MSAGRFVLGCLSAGVACNVAGITFVHLFLREPAMRMMERLGGISAWTPVVHGGMRLAMGSAALWVFVATRAKVTNTFGALLVSTCTCWVLIYPAILQVWKSLADLTWLMLFVAGVWGLFELGAIAWIGWLIAGKP